MKKIIFFFLICLSWIEIFAQPAQDPKDDSWKNIYRAAAIKINDLIHTRLDVRFDYDKSYLYGNAWITLKPHYYPTDSLILDAKGMEIKKVAITKGSNNLPLKYDYDGMLLHIYLDRMYWSTEDYTIYIDYVSKPDELKIQGSSAITGAKGLYFINPKGEEKNKPIQIWTQGETESNSAWFPTIDKPNQKSTEEIYMTVPDKYETLSNGKLISQKKNGDDTRTDYWKMDLPHAPYLFFMGVGDYAIIKDSYKGKEVNYYVEKEYAPFAKKIFGNTPEMIAFYSRITGIDFPWVKYDQIVGRDYVSGAMENTTATLHEQSAQQDARELVDGNRWEEVIAHELFHQWFGDLVTTESWSNLTLNESFADYSETLWNEYKYGKDKGDATNFEGLQAYLSQPENASKNLVRFYYADREDVFDAVTYSKGGRILNMLRNYVGDSAFFKSLNLYLTNNKFKSAEAQQLRLAFEEITGQDLNWFWNEWYYGNGHPKLNIDYAYDDNEKTVKVIVNQTQQGGNFFKMPLAIDIYNGSQKYRHKVWMENKSDTFSFGYLIKPDLVNVDGDKTLLCEKTDNKTIENFVHQYKYAGLYLDRRESIDYCANNQDDEKASALLMKALKDRFAGLRIYTMGKLDLKKETIKQMAEPIIFDIAQKDPQSLVRAKAIELLGSYKKTDYKPLFENGIRDSSYSVAGNSLESLAEIDMNDAMAYIQQIKKQPAKGELATAIAALLIASKDTNSFEIVADNFERITNLSDKMELLPGFAGMLISIQDNNQFKKGIDLVTKFRDGFPGKQHDEIVASINTNILKEIENFKETAGLKQQADYIKSKMK
jgi:aminopeptidase N